MSLYFIVGNLRTFLNSVVFVLVLSLKRFFVNFMQCTVFIMVALWSRADHYIFML